MSSHPAILTDPILAALLMTDKVGVIPVDANVTPVLAPGDEILGGLPVPSTLPLPVLDHALVCTTGEEPDLWHVSELMAEGGPLAGYVGDSDTPIKALVLPGLIEVPLHLGKVLGSMTLTGPVPIVDMDTSEGMPDDVARLAIGNGWAAYYPEGDGESVSMDAALPFLGDPAALIGRSAYLASNPQPTTAVNGCPTCDGAPILYGPRGCNACGNHGKCPPFPHGLTAPAGTVTELDLGGLT